jgi:hypothetical protein
VFRYEPPPARDPDRSSEESEEESDSESDDGTNDKRITLELLSRTADYISGILGGKYAGNVRYAIATIVDSADTRNVSRFFVRSKTKLVYDAYAAELPVDPLRRTNELAERAAAQIGVMARDIRAEALTIASGLRFYPHADDMRSVEDCLFRGQRPVPTAKSAPYTFEMSASEFTQRLSTYPVNALLHAICTLGVNRPPVETPSRQVLRQEELRAGYPGSLPIVNAGPAQIIMGGDHVREDIRIKVPGPRKHRESRATSPRSFVREKAQSHIDTAAREKRSRESRSARTPRAENPRVLSEHGDRGSLFKGGPRGGAMYNAPDVRGSRVHSD